jgi:hypothetical protein
MAHPISPFFHDPSFDPFLFAAIGEEQNGMLLSVLSALARLGLDPWREAESLSKLPALVATERLTTLLSSLPRTQLKATPPAMVTRLVALLPRASGHKALSPGAAGSADSRLSWPMALYVVLACVMMFVAQFGADRTQATNRRGRFACFKPRRPRRGKKTRRVARMACQGGSSRWRSVGLSVLSGAVAMMREAANYA